MISPKFKKILSALLIITPVILAILGYRLQVRDTKPRLVISTKPLSLFTLYKNTESQVVYYNSFGGFPQQIAFILIPRNPIPIPIIKAEIYSENCTVFHAIGLLDSPIPVPVAESELNGKTLLQDSPIEFYLNVKDIVDLNKSKRCKAILTIKTPEKEFYKKIKFIDQTPSNLLLLRL